MDNSLEKSRQDQKTLAIERQRMNEALTQLAQVDARRPAQTGGRLIFGLDLTGSREPGLRQARIATAAMFTAIKAIGRIAVKLIYFRGTQECRAGKWHDDPAVLGELMRGLSCEVGNTQIARLLRIALAETEKISCVVFEGDHCEDDPAELLALARELGKRSIPLFVFHECSDFDERSLRAKPVFKRMAEASGGVYCELFKPDSGAALRELLTSVAAFTAAGIEGVRKIRRAATTPEARSLQGRLLLGPASPAKGKQ